MKTGKERLAALRARRRKEGLRPYEVWVRPKDWPRIQRYIKRVTENGEAPHG